jgi:hypothetical protein
MTDPRILIVSCTKKQKSVSFDVNDTFRNELSEASGHNGTYRV